MKIPEPDPRRAGSLALVLALLPLLAACGTKRESNPFQGGENARVTIDVTNLNWGDATLWVHTLGGRTRLGTVGGEESRSFTLPLRTSQPISIEIDLLAGGNCRTREIQADPGDRLDLQIGDTDCSGRPYRIPQVSER